MLSALAHFSCGLCASGHCAGQCEVVSCLPSVECTRLKLLPCYSTSANLREPQDQQHQHHAYDAGLLGHPGLCHAIRLLLEYTDSSYEEKRYTMGDAPDYDRSQWLDEKFKLGLDFPNLPYLIDGPHKITQSNAILRYLGRKHDLCGETEEERIRVDILENQVMDTRMQFVGVCYSPDFEKRKVEYLQGLPEKMKLFSQFLGKRPWFAGDKITFVDFLAYDILDQQCLFEPQCLDAFPNLKDFMARLEGLEKISAYMKSSRVLSGPVYLKMALWGNK